MTPRPTSGSPTTPEGSKRKRATTAPAADPSPPQPHRLDPPTWLAWASVAFSTVMTTLVVWNSSGPALYSDEVGILAPSYIIAHPASPLTYVGDAYMPGTSMILAPIWWFSSDPATVYRAAIIVCALLSLAIIYPLMRLGQAFGLTRNAAMIVGSVVALAPGHIIYANYVWSEQAFSLVVAFAAWRGLELARKASARNAVLAALAIGATFACHGRGIAFAAVGGLALIALARRSVRAAIAGIAAYVVVVGGGYALFLWTSTRLHGAQGRTNSTLGSLSDQNIGEAVDAITAQTWYQVVGWAGLALIGVGFLITLARKGDDRVFARWALGAFGASLLFVAIYVAGSEPSHLRLDIHVYGRYFDGLAATLAALGLIVMVKGLTRHLAAVLAVAAVVISGLFLVISVPHFPAGGWWEPGHLPAISHMLSQVLVASDQKDPWASITFVLLLVVLIVLLLSKRSPIAIGMLVAYFTFVTISVDVEIIKPRETLARGVWPPARALETVPASESLAVDVSVDDYPFLWVEYTWWCLPRMVHFYNSERDERPSDLVLGSIGWDTAAQEGALPLLSSWAGDEIIWVFPGQTQDELLDEGLLLGGGVPVASP